MESKYDIFISYKRKSLPTANNLYYRLTTRSYSTFFDLEEMGRDNFNVQLLNYIDMSGNVWEWTGTPAHSYATDLDPEGNVFIRRGGSWWNEAKNCRVSKRYASDHFKKTSGLGLRVVIREDVE